MTDAGPYLSVVVAARNDDHGGGFIRRMQLFVDNLLSQCDRFDVEAELVVVEWNPPPGTTPLATRIVWPSSSRCTVRFVVVPPELHDRHENADRLALFQMIAKNVGIRRARGRFVLATNIDVLFSDGLMQEIAGRRLDAACFYRVDRHDVAEDVPVLPTPAEQLAACAEHVVRINTREATIDLRTGETVTIYPPRRRPAWLFRPLEPVARLLPELDLSARRTLLALVRRPNRGPARAVATARVELARLRRSWAVISPRLHTNACGDFTLMAREAWALVRGYDELPVSAWFIDSMLLFRVRRLGLHERYLPHPLFHVEHGRPPEPGVPRLTFDDLRAFVLDLRRGRVAEIANDESWGLGGEELQEARIESPLATAAGG